MTNTDNFLNRAVSIVGWLLLLAISIFYLYGIGTAISQSLLPPGKASYHPFLLATMGSIQAMLLANFGAALGITVTNPGSPVARAVSFGGGQSISPAADFVAAPMSIAGKIQVAGFIIYTLSIILCFIIWVKKDFTTNPTEIVAIVPESGKMFIGAGIAYLSAILARK